MTAPEAEHAGPLALQLRLERDTLHSGDTVRGVLTLVAEEPVTLRALTITPAWHMTGLLPERMGEVDPQTPAHGVVDAGRHERAFACALPEALDRAPPSSHGAVMGVSWVIEGYAEYTDQHGAVHRAEVSCPFTLRAARSEAPRPDRSEQRHAPSTSRAAIGCGIIFLALGLLLPYGLWSVAAEKRPYFDSFVLLAVCWIIGIPVLRMGLERLQVGAMLGAVTTTVTPDVLRPGDTAQLTVRFTPRKLVHYADITGRLRGEDQRFQLDTSGSTPRQHIHSGTLYVEEVAMARDETLARGEPVERTVTLHIPEDAPVSVRLLRGAIVWNAVVRVEVPGKQTWEATHPVTIHPPLRSGHR